MDIIEVKTADLSGSALDWAVGKADGLDVRNSGPSVWVKGKIPGAGTSDDYYNPTVDWRIGGPLIEKYGILISPREAMVHVHGGPQAGWRESGYWGATIFRKGQHRRRAHQHETLPLVAAMRCIVNWSLGDTVQVPKELMS